MCSSNPYAVSFHPRLEQYHSSVSLYIFFSFKKTKLYFREKNVLRRKQQMEESHKIVKCVCFSPQRV